jgi:hypothetical protein
MAGRILKIEALTGPFQVILIASVILLNRIMLEWPIAFFTVTISSPFPAWLMQISLSRMA